MTTTPKNAWARAWVLHKRREVATCLEGSDYEEWSRLSAYGKGRDDLTPEQEARLKRLEQIASLTYRKLLSEPVVLTPENDLGLYAKQIGDEMRAQQAASADPGTSGPAEK